MKALITVVGLLLTFVSAVAKQPSVGDYAVYKLTTPGFKGEYKVELTAYDTVSNLYTKTHTTRFNDNRPTIETETVGREDLSSTEEMEAVLDFCETTDVNGSLVTVVVGAGTFKTCKLNTNDGDTYVAPVPFSVVQIISGQSTLELVEYGTGK